MAAPNSGSGRPRVIDEALLARWPLPKLPRGGDKGARGDVLVIGGSAQIPGAVLLSATAALRAGAGRVQVVTVRSVAPGLAIAMPEARVIGLPQDRQGELLPRSASALAPEIEACNALVLGPGMRSERAARELYRRCMAQACTGQIVLDAAALSVLSPGRRLTIGDGRSVIATPHAGEMASVWGCRKSEVEAAPRELAREVARTLGVVLVLKGAETFVAGPDGELLVNLVGNSGLATAGSGDTLAGVIAGLAARGAPPMQAAAWGVWLHAKAGEALARKVGPLGYLARELAAEIPRLLLRPGRRAQSQRAG